MTLESPRRPLSVRLFGELELRLGDELLPRLESARARSLLAFLLLNRGAPQSRQRLAFMLWPDSTESQARTNLRHLIHTLRQTGPDLDQYLEVTPQTITWRDDAAGWVDVAAFEAAQRTSQQPELSAGHEGALRAAIDIYRGDLLEGCYDEWVLDLRERFRDQYLVQLQRLAESLADDGRTAEAIRVGRELLRRDPLREDTYRFLMRSHLAAGDRAGAARLYHECVSTLRRELGVEPSSATVDTYVDLVGSPAGEPNERTVPLSLGSRLVGREIEWQVLTDRWSEAEQGRSQLVLISGEAGVGKTRLAEELSAWCRHRGAIVAEARSYSTEGELGYGVVISWLRSADVEARLRGLAPADRTALGRLLPDLQGLDASPEPQDLDVAEQRQRLFGAVGRTLAAAEHPILLIADDAQWCDAQSFQVLHYLTRGDASMPVMVVANARSEDIDEAHPLRLLVGGLQAIDRATEIALAGLSKDDTEQLASETTKTTFDRTDLDALFAATAGNPLFVVETVRAGWEGSLERVSSLTPKLRAVIDSRLRQLATPTRAVLALAATVGREFTTDVLSAALSSADVDVVGALDELWRRGIIREHGIEAYDFAHGKIRDAAYESLSPAVRRRNHRLIASTLIAVRHRDLDSVCGEVARHFDRAGEWDSAVTWYERAAGLAQRMYADIEATQLLERACELAAEASNEISAERHLELLSALSTPLSSTEGFSSSRLVEVQRTALDLVAALGVEPDPALLRSVAMTNLCLKDFEGSRTVAERLRSLAERTSDDVLKIESEYLLGIGAFWAGAFAQAREHFESAVRQFDADRRVEHLVRFGQDPRVVCVSRLANAMWFLGHADDARNIREDALAMATEAGHPFSRGVALVFAALVSVDLGDLDRFRELAGLMEMGSQHHPFVVAQEALLGYADVLDGNSQRGIERIRHTLEIGAVDPAPGQHASHTRLLLAAFDTVGDAAAGLQAADDALRAPGTRIWESETRRLRAVFLHGMGAPPGEIDSEIQRSIDAARRFGAMGPLTRAEQTRSDLALLR